MVTKKQEAGFTCATPRCKNPVKAEMWCFKCETQGIEIVKKKAVRDAKKKSTGEQVKKARRIKQNPVKKPNQFYLTLRDGTAIRVRTTSYSILLDIGDDDYRLSLGEAQNLFVALQAAWRDVAGL